MRICRNVGNACGRNSVDWIVIVTSYNSETVIGKINCFQMFVNSLKLFA